MGIKGRPGRRHFPRAPKRFSAPSSSMAQYTPMSTATDNQKSNANSANANADYGTGYLEISEKGFGFLRTAQNHFHPKPADIFVTPDTIKRSFLREGSLVAGPTQPPHR